MYTAERNNQYYLGNCPVCGGGTARRHAVYESCLYWRCTACRATFLDREHLPGHAYEFSRYELHENELGDPRYRGFLSKLAEPLLAVLPPKQAGLDFGCGPGPALAAMMGEAGHTMSLYDPFYQTDKNVLDCKYDFITCSEAAEHFHHPLAEFQLLDGILKPGGWLAVMTCFQTEDALFERWHYRNDPTHVTFYKEDTFRHLSEIFGWHCTIPCKDVALMQK